MDRAGIREVAKAAGVSISTVSRAFKRPELVSERTRRKVLETADKLDFNISRSATSLKSGQSYRVAMLMNEEITSWFNTEVFAGIDSVMHDAGYDISLFQHVDTAENRKEFFTNLPVRRNVDAVFVTSFGVDPKEIQQLKRIHVPIIGINTPTQSGFDATISIDDEDGMFLHRLAWTGLHPRLQDHGKHARLQVARRFRAAWQDVRRFGIDRAAGARRIPGRHLLPDGYDGDSAGAAFGTVRPPHAF